VKRFAWATDIHLDHLVNRSLEQSAQDAVFDFFARVSKEPIDGLFLTGDISTGRSLLEHLSIIERAFDRHVYFVLGNHDYWATSTSDMRAELTKVTKSSQTIKYLGALDFVSLTPTTALVGHDGWYDALNGNYKASRFYLNDWDLTLDFLGARDIDSIVNVSRTLAAGSVAHIERGIELAAAAGHKTVVVLTHYPPFEEAHVYRGRLGDVDATPWYTSRMMGEMLLCAAAKNPSICFQVFAGHTHGAARVKVAANMVVEVGEADYGRPMLQRIVNVA
jgi:predicted phosphohydrolase